MIDSIRVKDMNLKERLYYAGLSQSEVGRRMGIPQHAVSMLASYGHLYDELVKIVDSEIGARHKGS